MLAFFDCFDCGLSRSHLFRVPAAFTRHALQMLQHSFPALFIQRKEGFHDPLTIAGKDGIPNMLKKISRSAQF